MSLTPKQRELCAAFGLPETLVEVAAEVPETSETETPEAAAVSNAAAAKDAQDHLEMIKAAKEQVAKDVRAAWNTKPDKVTFYPSTETPLKAK